MQLVANNQTLTPLRIAFLFIAVLSALGNVVVPFVYSGMDLAGQIGDDRWDTETVVVGILTGLLIGEFVSIAFWMVFDPILLRNKLLFGTFLGCVFAACLISGLQVWPGMPVAAGVFILIVGAFLPWAIAGLVYCVARLASPEVLRSMFAFESPSRSQQYGIGFLLAMMSVVALVITIIRFVLPDGGSDWLSAYEFAFVGVWCGWLAMGVSVLVWGSFVSVMQPTLVHVGVTLTTVLLGPGFFQWISSFLLVGSMRIRFSNFFDALPQSISFGLLATGILLGAIFRAFGRVERGEVSVDPVSDEEIK